MSRSKCEDKGVSRRDVLKIGGALITSTALCGLLPKTSAAKEARTPTNFKFKKLLEPGRIGKLKIKNRIIKSGAGSGGMAEPTADGLVRQEALDYYGAIAKGGAGLVCMEMSTPSPQLADEIHKYDVPTIIQFHDMRNLGFGPSVMSSSTVNFPSELDMNNAKPEMMTTDQVRQARDGFIASAVKAKKAGYDGIEINAGCSHLLDTFLSRFWNTERTDQYGSQSLENRARIVTEIIQSVKQECGADFVISVLFNGVETNVFSLGDNSGCITFEESTGLAKLFEKAGADFLHVRTATFGSHMGGFFPESFFIGADGHTGYGTIMDFEKDFPKFYYQQQGAGAFIDIAARIKQAVSIPIGTVGVMDPRLAPGLMENAIRDGKIDFILMCRPLVADPDLPNKLASGKLDEVIPCTHCLTCFQSGDDGMAMFCRVNAAVYRAGKSVMPEGYDVEPAATKKKVMVVGGGPGGMEAARVAALRGHEVTLYEKSSELGGLMPLADMVKEHYEKIGDFTDYLTKQMQKRGVNVKLKQEVTPSLVDRVKPDAVIVATGGIPTIPDIPGIDNPKVIGTVKLFDKLSSLMKSLGPNAKPGPEANFLGPVGQKVVIIGGQYLGVNMAEFLVKMGKIVTIVDEDKVDLGDTTAMPSGGRPDAMPSGGGPTGMPSGGRPTAMPSGGGPTGMPSGGRPARMPKSNLGKGITNQIKSRLINYLKSMNVRMKMGVKYEKITHAGLTIKTGNGETETIPADIIIVALPFTANTGLADGLKGRVPEVYAIGDCQNPGVITGAVAGANLTARRI